MPVLLYLGQELGRCPHMLVVHWQLIRMITWVHLPAVIVIDLADLAVGHSM